MKKILLVSIVSVLTLSGCMSSMSKTGSDYSVKEVRQAGEVFYGKLEGVRTIKINNPQNTNMVGTGAGGLLGGLIGSSMGGNNGMILGGLAGAVAGAVASEKLTGETEGWEFDINIKGKIIVVTQQKSEGETFYKGQDVRVVKYGNEFRVSSK